MGYLWFVYWLLVDGVDVITENFFPIGFTIAAVGSGFCLGYLYRFLFAEPGNKELLVMRCEEKTEEVEYEHMH